MAKSEGGRARPAAKKKAAKGKGSSDKVVDLAAHKAGKNASIPDGTNSGEPVVSALIVGEKDTQAFVIWEGKIRRQWGTLGKAKEAAKKESFALQTLYSEAKESGIPAQRLSSLKKRLKLEERPIEDVVAEHQEIAWQVSVVKGSKLRQLGLFDVSEPTPAGYEILGEKAGKEGGHIDNAPGKQGDEKYTRWLTGFKRGQKELAESTFNAGVKVDNDGEGEDALGM